MAPLVKTQPLVRNAVVNAAMIVAVHHAVVSVLSVTPVHQQISPLPQKLQKSPLLLSKQIDPPLFENRTPRIDPWPFFPVE